MAEQKSVFIPQDEGCKIIGVSYPTMRRMVKEGKIPAPIALRRRKYFRRADLLAALDNLGTIEEPQTA